MDDITLNLIVIAVLAVVGMAVFLLVRKKGVKKEEQLLQAAARLGWKVTKLQDLKQKGWRFEATAPGKVLPFPWTMESVTILGQPTADFSTSTNINQRTTWWSDAVKLEKGLVLAGPRPASNSPALEKSMVSSMLAQAALRLMIGDNAAQLPGLAEVQVVGQRWSVWAHDAALSARLFTGEVEAALAKLPADLQIVMRLNQHQLTLEVRDQQLSEIDTLANLVALGERLVEAARQ